MVIVKGDLFRDYDDIYKLYKAKKETIEKYKEYIVAQSMEEIDGFRERSKSSPVKFELENAKSSCGVKKISKP